MSLNIPSGKLTVWPWKQPSFNGFTNLPTPMTARVYVNLPEGNIHQQPHQYHQSLSYTTINTMSGYFFWNETWHHHFSKVRKKSARNNWVQGMNNCKVSWPVWRRPSLQLGSQQQLWLIIGIFRWISWDIANYITLEMVLRYSDIHLDILRDIVDITIDISKKSSLARRQPGHSRNQWRISARSSAGEVFGLEWGRVAGRRRYPLVNIQKTIW